MFSEGIRVRAKNLVEPAGAKLARLGVAADALTILGFLGNVGAGALVGLGQVRWAGVAMLASSALDALDGAVARAQGKVSLFGGFLDSTLDRLSEAAVFGGLLWLYTYGRANQTYPLAPLLVYVALVGSLLVSYTRARAEGLGLECKVGLFTRTERILILSLGLILRQEIIALWILAILANFTVLQRIWHIWRTTRVL